MIAQICHNQCHSFVVTGKGVTRKGEGGLFIHTFAQLHF